MFAMNKVMLGWMSENTFMIDLRSTKYLIPKPSINQTYKQSLNEVIPLFSLDRSRSDCCQWKCRRFWRRWDCITGLQTHAHARTQSMSERACGYIRCWYLPLQELCILTSQQAQLFSSETFESFISRLIWSCVCQSRYRETAACSNALTQNFTMDMTFMLSVFLIPFVNGFEWRNTLRSLVWRDWLICCEAQPRSSMLQWNNSISSPHCPAWIP